MTTRREFMRLASAGGLSLAGGIMATAPAMAASGSTPVDQLVALTGDNVPMLMADYPKQLLRLLDGRSGLNDFYLADGAVAALEDAFSKQLGKEAAVFMPTGTMANQIAIRLLCGDRRRLLLQEESHVYQDESDAASILSGINQIPLHGGVGQGLYSAIEAAFAPQGEAPYPVSVGAVSLESPVRRLDGATLTPDLVGRIAQLARRHGAGLHLDGARLLLMSGMRGFHARDYCAPFDTVYVSLYKYLGAPFGAVLAGDKALMERARAFRHVLGGTIFHGWEAALPALDRFTGFEQRFIQARRAGEQLLDLLGRVDGIVVHHVPNGSNVAFLALDSRMASGLAERLERAGIVVAAVESGRLRLTINETILRKPVAAIAAAFMR